MDTQDISQRGLPVLLLPPLQDDDRTRFASSAEHIEILGCIDEVHVLEAKAAAG